MSLANISTAGFPATDASRSASNGGAASLPYVQGELDNDGRAELPVTNANTKLIVSVRFDGDTDYQSDFRREDSSNTTHIVVISTGGPADAEKPITLFYQ